MAFERRILGQCTGSLTDIGNYLRKRTLLYETLEDPRRMEVTSGIGQRSILGPHLWSTSYDSFLRFNMPEGSALVGYADDAAEKTKVVNLTRKRNPNLRSISPDELSRDLYKE